MNLPVEDVPAATDFLERYFGLRPAGPAHRNFAMLHDEGGFTLTLMGIGGSNTVSYPKTFHIGFIQRSKADVDEVNRRLKEGGFEVEAPSQQHGAWAFSFDAPGGFALVVRGPDKFHG